ncbi:MAG: GNAT family N-acetyltransferase [Dehalococcoidia bacterium]
MTAIQDDVLIQGDLIQLRRKRLGDAPTDYGWRTDPELAGFDAAGPLRTSYEDYLSLYREELQYPGPYRHMFAIETRGGRHIGNVMYYNIDERRSECELGITIGEREYWNQGYGRDAVEAFVRLIFITTNLRRVYLNTLEWNERAQRAFEAGGFNPCGRRRRDGNIFVTMEALRDGAPPPRRSRLFPS